MTAGDLLAQPLAHRHPLETTGIIYMEFEGSVLCRSPVSAERGMVGECLPVDFDWAQLGGDQKQVWRVLEQWSGKMVRIEGAFVPKYEGYAGPEGRLRCVYNVELLEGRAGRSPSYCLGDRGPRPTGPGGILDASVPDNGTRRGIRELDSGAVVYLDATSLTVRVVRGTGSDVETTEIPLSLPPPFRSGWDVWEFQPVNESTFVFTLVDDALYGVKEGVVSRLEEATVDLLRPSAGGVLFRSRRFDGKELVWTALRRVDAELEVETRWASGTRDPHWHPPALTGVWGPVLGTTPRSPSHAEPSCRDLVPARHGARRD